MEIISNFGLNPILLGAQIVNFLIVFFVLKKFLYKPILEVLNKRKVTIKEGLRAAEDARVKLEKVVIEEKNILRLAQLQSKKILEDAKLESEAIAKKMGEDSRRQTEELLKDAREQIAKESAETEKKLALSTSKLSIKVLERALQEFFSSKEQKEIISKALKKIKIS